MKYLYLLFRLFKCPHKWKTLHIENVYWSEEDRENKCYYYKANYSQCTKCGATKVFKLKE